MIEKFRVHPDLQYKYSDIGKYVGEDYSNEPLRNDEVVDLLNSQDKKIKDLEAELEDCKTLHFRKTIKWRGY